jgi:hypothetical protein
MSASGVFANWLGVFLDAPVESEVDWSHIAAILEDAFRKVAPKKLIGELDCKLPVRKSRGVKALR